ncbi:UNVERIFIED_CONTAM: hypothetical protein Sradi_6658200 [Sesamum radiatum]|uniref:SWIM-type domain-containing protein n=1 Tax=Sesamum radiatum TaxID=300843 RepID=A0AAW2JPB0_SESRA
MHGIQSSNLSLTCSIPSCVMRMHVKNDQDVLNMLDGNQNRDEFDLFVVVNQEGGNNEVEASVEHVGVECGVHEGENIDEDIDNESGSSGHESGGSEESMYAAATDEEFDDTSVSLVSSDDDHMSGYKSDDHCETENLSDEEFCSDPMKGALSRDACVVHGGSGDKIKLEKGMVFTDVVAFRDALREYVIQEGFKIMRLRNERVRVTAHCAVKDCPWRVHASILADGVTFQIKTYVEKHTCIYRAKKKALEVIEGNHAISFGKLPYYVKMVSITNEGSVVTLQSEANDDESISATPMFKRFFLGLSALRDGFLAGCSPFLGFDGCHLKGPFGGVLLAAIGLDGNNGLYPVAFAVAESECKESWMFFFENLANMLGGFSSDLPWTFMSDRQKGLVETINELVPYAINRRCARHIYANFRQQFAGAALKRYFWEAARSYNAQGFNFAMYKIKELKPAAYEWLLKVPAEQWSRHAFDIRMKNDHVTNNISESFNHWVGDLRGKPILTLVDGLRSKLMSRIQKRKQKGASWKGTIVPNVVKLLNNVREESRKCSLLMAGEGEYEVNDANVHYIVNLRKRTCNCKFWDIVGIPCRHAALGIAHRREELENYTDVRFSKQKYMRAYGHCIHPIPDPSFWPENMDVTPIDLKPPAIKRMPGRPKKSRRKEPGEAPGAVRRANVEVQDL